VAPGPRCIVAAGAFVVSLDSMVAIAVPAMAAAFALPPDAMRRVIISAQGTSARARTAGSAAMPGPRSGLPMT